MAAFPSVPHPTFPPHPPVREPGGSCCSRTDWDYSCTKGGNGTTCHKAIALIKLITKHTGSFPGLSIQNPLSMAAAGASSGGAVGWLTG